MLSSALDGYLQVFRRFADFDGRSGRRELWSFAAVHVVATGLLLAGSTAVGTLVDLSWVAGSAALALYVAISFVPALAVVARRLHDTGRSSLLVAVGLVPVVGLVLLYWLVLPGDAGPNAYGQDPSTRPFGDYDRV